MVSLADRRPPPPCPAAFNLAQHVLRAGADAKVALRLVTANGGTDVSFAQLRAAVAGAAKRLQTTGIGAGDFVLLRLGNTVEFPVVFLALAAIGAIPIITSAQATTAEVDQMLDQCPASAMVQDANIAGPTGPIPCIAATGLVDWAAPHALDFQMGPPDRPGYVMFTSGTSGTPKAVLHAHRAIWARQMMWDGWYGLCPDDRMLHAGAFNWSYTLGTGLLDPWAMGATAIIAPGTDVQALPQVIAHERATIFAAAPGVYRKILQAAGLPKMTHLRHGLSAGDKISPAITSAWQSATSTPIFEAYGMTECSTFLSSSPGGARALTAQPGRAIAIVGPEGPVPHGQSGHIAVHASDPGLMLGYLDQGTWKLPQKGDWFVTTDQGVMDRGGTITFTGRSRDMMNAGGFRVSPLEVEAALSQATALDLAVGEVAVKDDVTIITAFLVDASPQDCETLAHHAGQVLARYKQPRAFVPVPDLPRSANGKLLRHKLQSLWEEHHG